MQDFTAHITTDNLYGPPEVEQHTYVIQADEEQLISPKMMALLVLMLKV